VPPLKCCRSTPRCRNCPARTIQDDRVLEALGLPTDPRPNHARLLCLPPSLHKYAPLLERREAEPV
jgi:hypothetical protein